MSLRERITALSQQIASDVRSLINALSGKVDNTAPSSTFLGRRTPGVGPLEPLSPSEAKVLLEPTNILGSRTIVFGGTGVPETGTNMTPLVVTNFYGRMLDARLTVKTPPSGGAFVLRVFSSSNDDLSDPTQILEISLGSTFRTISTTIDSIVAKNRFLSLNIVSVNGAADWKLELLHIEKIEPII
jgi:hypothetical protein